MFCSLCYFVNFKQLLYVNMLIYVVDICSCFFFFGRNQKTVKGTHWQSFPRPLSLYPVCLHTLPSSVCTGRCQSHIHIVPRPGLYQTGIPGYHLCKSGGLGFLNVRPMRLWKIQGYYSGNVAIEPWLSQPSSSVWNSRVWLTTKIYQSRFRAVPIKTGAPRWYKLVCKMSLLRHTKCTTAYFNREKWNWLDAIRNTYFEYNSCSHLHCISKLTGKLRDGQRQDASKNSLLGLYSAHDFQTDIQFSVRWIFSGFPHPSWFHFLYVCIL